MLSRGSNPRRNAIEYGIFIGLSTSMVCAYGVMIYVFSTPGKDGQPRKLGKVNLNEPVNFGIMWKELMDGNGISGLLGDTTTTQNQSRDTNYPTHQPTK